MKDLFDSLVRTYVPWLAGIVIGWLVSLGVPLDPEVAPQITAVLMLGASALWYFLARIFETYVHPKLGWLIGLPKQPLYGAPTKDEILADFARLDPDEQNADLQAALARRR
ncbi:hypothetical protein PTQ19_10470 [Microbacterium esteraromaticum]|uniref:hypothetical protein n=1 Tax=Microbacterium esteraromaticum TaxID=57043 RepID=UPI0023684C87|nr:hypothetical protein [Microbacterium esteraromaticum]WDH77946.1 hypothetical protein PTQ19_10470 [Microbacterium esteraromaticum]